jgi:putative transposase
VRVIAVAPHWTSQDCSNCGQKVLKSLSTRTHKCPHCGYVATRDQNSAINILRKALKQLATTVGHAESNAFGENPLCPPLEIRVGKGTRRKRKLSH